MVATQDQKRILIAEDCPDTQKILQLMLEQTGAEVILADDGRECLDRIFNQNAQPVDVVVMDIKMPRLDGLMALKEMRDKGCQTPTVILTASPSDDGEESAKQLGCKAYLSKLKDRANILPTIKKILEENTTAKEQIALPVLPVYPDALPQDAESRTTLLSYLGRVSDIQPKLKESLGRTDGDALTDCIIELGAASFYGYKLLADQLELLREAIAERDSGRITRFGSVVLRTLAGMLAARPKI